MFLSAAIVGACLLSIVATYMKVTQLTGNRLMQIVRLSPIMVYLALALSFTYVPALLLYSLLALLVLGLVGIGFWLSNSYVAARDAVPSTKAEWLRRLRYAPYLLGVLVVIYIAGIRFDAYQNTTPYHPKPPATPGDTLISTPSRNEKTDEELWNELKDQQP